jgi:isopentenyl-diphosphate delta-isomerase
MKVNGALAAAAAVAGCAIGVGSQRAALRSTKLAETYAIARERAPHALLIANIGLPQLLPQSEGQPLAAADVRRLVGMLKADALAVHLNYLQECVQPEGQPRARGAVSALRRIIRAVRVPVIAKETGSGMTRSTARELIRIGVAGLDVGGRGGTSFALIEARRARDQGDAAKARLGSVFAEWGIPTPVAVADCAGLTRPVIATGGVRSGLDAAKALALGASLVGVARPLLQAALEGEAAVISWIRQFEVELRVAMFLCDARSIKDLRKRAILTGTTAEWVRQLRHLR